MSALGAKLIEHGVDFEEARDEAHRLAAAEDQVFVPSFAPDLVKGVASYALELFRAEPWLDAVYVPIGPWIRHLRHYPGARLARSDDAGDWGSKHRRRLLCADPLPPVTWWRATGLTPRPMASRCANRIPRRCESSLRGAERIVTVTDQQIAAAIRAYWTDTHNLIEGAGAAPLAALLQETEADARQTRGADCQRRQYRPGAVPVMARVTHTTTVAFRYLKVLAFAPVHAMLHWGRQGEHETCLRTFGPLGYLIWEPVK